jgi:hypothetical protein
MAQLLPNIKLTKRLFLRSLENMPLLLAPLSGAGIKDWPNTARGKERKR